MNAIKVSSSIVLAYLLAACASLSFPKGDGPKGVDSPIDAEEYEAYLVRRPFGTKSDSKRFQLAMTYLHPETQLHDPAKARKHLWQLEGSTASPYGRVAVQVLALLKEVERLRSEAALEARRLQRVSAEAARLRGAIEVAENRISEQGESASRLQVELQSAYGKLRRLGEESASQKQEIERLTRELRELKRIDTRQAP